MPFALLIIGLVLLVSSVRNSHGDFFALVKGDFTGPNNFIFWVVSILLIGSVGYIPKLKPLSTAFLVLVILVLVLVKGNPKAQSGGFFQKFTEALNGTSTSKDATKPASSPSSVFSLPSIPSIMF